MDIADGKLEQEGIPKGILDSPHHFDILKRVMHEKYLPPLKLHEFFMVDVELEFYNLTNTALVKYIRYFRLYFTLFVLLFKK